MQPIPKEESRRSRTGRLNKPARRNRILHCCVMYCLPLTKSERTVDSGVAQAQESGTAAAGEREQCSWSNPTIGGLSAMNPTGRVVKNSLHDCHDYDVVLHEFFVSEVWLILTQQTVVTQVSSQQPFPPSSVLCAVYTSYPTPSAPFSHLLVGRSRLLISGYLTKKKSLEGLKKGSGSSESIRCRCKSQATRQAVFLSLAFPF
ncbi:hypothetical protein QBC43DRAFT_58395 [Cladorrhinum sp. PSN259]|nr:hypothetical protein QBC43DRAFT_58395 [Cladorrhinum sp. PSN259]